MQRTILAAASIFRMTFFRRYENPTLEHLKTNFIQSMFGSERSKLLLRNIPLIIVPKSDCSENKTEQLTINFKTALSFFFQKNQFFILNPILRSFWLSEKN